MDIALDTENTLLSPEDLPYDAITARDEVADTEVEPTLASRIGSTKVYFMPEPPAGSSRAGKRKHVDDDVEEDEDDLPANTSIRENAIFLNGTPISQLPTNNIFAYATSLDTKPTALEWIDDTSCILVFSTRAAARRAYANLSKLTTEESSEDGFFTAKPIPMALWPPETRVSSSLGKGEGLKGPMHLRWATPSDVKKRGANKQSEFYRRYGRMAGREDNVEDLQTAKRQRRFTSDAEQKAELDQELDEFLTEDQGSAPAPPASKMRSDYMASGKTLFGRARRDLQSRLSESTGRQRNRTREWDENVQENRLDPRGSLSDRIGNRRGRSRERRGGRMTRPKKTAEDLDAELDSFLEGGTGQG